MSNQFKLIVCEDNEAVIKIVLKQRSPALRHVSRTHRINLDWTFEVMQNENVLLKYVNTKFQTADMMTKAFTRKETWETLLSLAALGPSSGQSLEGSRHPQVLTEKRTNVANISQVKNASVCTIKGGSQDSPEPQFPSRISLRSLQSIMRAKLSNVKGIQNQQTTERACICIESSVHDRALKLGPRAIRRWDLPSQLASGTTAMAATSASSFIRAGRDAGQGNGSRWNSQFNQKKVKEATSGVAEMPADTPQGSAVFRPVDFELGHALSDVRFTKFSANNDLEKKNVEGRVPTWENYDLAPDDDVETMIEKEEIMKPYPATQTLKDHHDSPNTLLQGGLKTEKKAVNAVDASMLDVENHFQSYGDTNSEILDGTLGEFYELKPSGRFHIDLHSQNADSDVGLILADTVGTRVSFGSSDSGKRSIGTGPESEPIKKNTEVMQDSVTVNRKFLKPNHQVHKVYGLWLALIFFVVLAAGQPTPRDGPVEEGQDDAGHWIAFTLIFLGVIFGASSVGMVRVISNGRTTRPTRTVTRDQGTQTPGVFKNTMPREMITTMGGECFHREGCQTLARSRNLLRRRRCEVCLG